METTTIKDLCRRAYNEAFPGVGDGAHKHLLMSDEIREKVSGFDGVKTNLYLAFEPQTEDFIRFSAVFSDLTSIFICDQPYSLLTSDIGSSKPGIRWPEGVSIPKSFLEKGGPLEYIQMEYGRPVLFAAYGFGAGEKFQSLATQLGGLAESGRIIVRPWPMIFVKTSKTPGSGRRPKPSKVTKVGEMNFDGFEHHVDLGEIPQDPTVTSQFTMVSVDPDSAGVHWYVTPPQRGALTLKREGSEPVNETVLAEIVLPYLKGIPFGVLAKILEDEEPYLSDLRTSVRNLLKQSEDEPRQSQDIANDIIKPAVDKVERRFRSISESRAINAAFAGVSLFAVVLTLNVSLQPNITQPLAALFGSGLAKVVWDKVNEDKKAQAEAKESPFYLLWRFKRERRL